MKKMEKEGERERNEDNFWNVAEMRNKDRNF